MDTRGKIVNASQLASLAPRPLLIVVGRFDILRAETVREIAAARARTGAGTVLAVVRPVAGELAPLAARAEMAAALRVVDYVFIAKTGDLADLPGTLQAVEIMNLEEAEARRTRQLTEHVQSRQSA